MALLIIVIFLLSCEKTDLLSLQNTNNHKYIALQPLGDFKQDELAFLKNELGDFFNIPVVILHPVPLPAGSNMSYRSDTYSADAIIQYLLQFKNDSIVEVVGLTHKHICANEKQELHAGLANLKMPVSSPVFGYGYVAGNSCVISDSKLVSSDKALYNNRLRKVVFHEIGHNMGLQHCASDKCIMSEANSNLFNLSKPGDYCDQCRRLLK